MKRYPSIWYRQWLGIDELAPAFLLSILIGGIFVAVCMGFSSLLPDGENVELALALVTFLPVIIGFTLSVLIVFICNKIFMLNSAFVILLGMIIPVLVAILLFESSEMLAVVLPMLTGAIVSGAFWFIGTRSVDQE